jgi:hypothetical protein
MKTLGSIVFVASGLLASVAVAEQPKPVQNITKHRPNLEAAQRLSSEAFQKITAAQAANEYDLGGHAAKAKALLEQVNVELKEAANAANKAAK